MFGKLIFYMNYFKYFMFGKYNGFVSKAKVSACMYFLVYIIYCWPVFARNLDHKDLINDIAFAAVRHWRLVDCFLYSGVETES